MCVYVCSYYIVLAEYYRNDIMNKKKIIIYWYQLIIYILTVQYVMSGVVSGGVGVTMDLLYNIIILVKSIIKELQCNRYIYIHIFNIA